MELIYRIWGFKSTTNVGMGRDAVEVNEEPVRQECTAYIAINKATYCRSTRRVQCERT